MNLKSDGLRVLSNPLVSVVCGTYNAMNFIDNVIASLRAQTYKHWQCLFVDDGSTDGTADYLGALARSDARFLLYRKTPEGSPARSRNVGIAKATGTLIAFCDHDDFWAPQKLEFQVNAWRQHPDASIIHTARTLWTLRSLPETWPQFREPEEFAVQSFEQALLQGCKITHSSVVIPKILLDDIGRLHPDLRGVDDYHAFLKLGQKGPIIRLPHELTYYYWHEGNLSHADNLFIAGLRKMAAIMAKEGTPEGVIASLEAQAIKSEAVLQLVTNPWQSVHLARKSLRRYPLPQTYKVLAMGLVGLLLPQSLRRHLVESLRGEAAVGQLEQPEVTEA